MIKYFTFLLFLFAGQCLGQLGTQINYPVSNDTVQPGQKVDIAYGYQNMGNGTYKVDVDLWQDSALSILAQNIAQNVSVTGGNSTGTQLAFYLNSTYGWTVPHGLNSTVYLTVTTKADLAYSSVDISMRSRGIVLHVNSGYQHMPQQFSLFAFVMIVLCFLL
ncbi:uncharacterized protein B0P05DRAFT_587299 [Gilbertella persicaria]|uniref:Uncharacterized protein n=1 Tax=Rhizopus stolonifer TaxID=4846 RepID=A0A367KGP4_RHIST|nr:uncharacterized protein B0P05DRAFT_587299 [Gilbertella persicaria]KAI8079078.1 hypothetical protein B0P05DRAFT_587299 [Gilbertella persicaria]RCI01311.1 hypothetical protein CU098_007060 [Rhizopus stolonifer]